jgi:branched-chain amino acid transport system ATP-binding protein
MTAGAANLLELVDVRSGYGPTSVLHGVSLQVPEGSIVSLLGANGAGKTTTLRAITGVIRWTGDIRFAGHSLRRMATEDIVSLGIAHVPEGRGILTELSVDENLRLGAHKRKDRDAVRKDYDRVFEYFPVLRERRRLSASTLSGGEQQMLAVARALLMKPRLMLLDEPSLGLAPMVVRSIFEIIRTVNQTDHVAVLLVEQNARLALELSSDAYVLEVGRVAVSGKSAELQGQESVRRSYLGY